MLHIGQLIACTLHEQGRTVTWFARQLCCTRPNVYKIFGKENIDISLLSLFVSFVTFFHLICIRFDLTFSETFHRK